MAHERCHLCDTEFASGEGWSVLCERCDARTEALRERLGVSGDVDEVEPIQWWRK